MEDQFKISAFEVQNKHGAFGQKCIGQALNTPGTFANFPDDGTTPRGIQQIKMDLIVINAKLDTILDVLRGKGWIK